MHGNLQAYCCCFAATKIKYLRLRINYHTQFGEQVYVSGGGVLGDWKQPVPLNSRANADWEVTLIVPADTADLDYKYYVDQLGGTAQWEGGGNRTARLSQLSEGQMMEIRDNWRVQKIRKNCILSVLINLII